MTGAGLQRPTSVPSPAPTGLLWPDVLPRRVAGLRELFAHGRGEPAAGRAPRALLVDVWGVLTDGTRAFPRALEAVAAARALGVPVVLVSNTSRRSGELAAMLAVQGIGETHFDAIVTGGELAFHHVRALSEPRRLQGSPQLRALVLGHQPGGHWAAAAGLAETDDPDAADLVLGVGILGELDGAVPLGQERPDTPTLEILRHAAGRRLPMILTNADRRVRLAGRLYAGIGILADAYWAPGQGPSGTVSVFGKPGRAVFDAGLALAGRVPAGEALMIGDTLTTDIAGAAALGARTLLVSREGSHAATLHPGPGGALCAGGLAGLIEETGIRPDHVMEALKW